MKLRTIGRHFREGGKSVWRNGWMTIASVGAVTTTLLLVSFFLAIMLNLNEVANNLEEDVEIRALIDLTADQAQIDALGKQIERIPEVSSVVFSSKDQELQNLIASLDDDVWKLYEQDNPLNHAYIVKTEDPLETINVAKEIETFNNVFQVNYGQDVVQNLFNFNKYARSVGIALIVALVLTATFLISNTIKITIMARSREIGIMKLVGATNWFIRWPFFVEGMLLGILGSILPVTGVLVGYNYLVENSSIFTKYKFIELLPFNPFAWQLSLMIVSIGAIIGIWGSVMSVRKFLKV